ncbi:MAG: hypothetical protein K0U23_03475 [Gammaproteobacteria bacterium]|nr:hypothetical protein [Gammaproteobacteria bacterium]
MKIAIKAILVLAITLLGCSQVYAVNKKGSCGAGSGAKTSRISAKAKSHSCTNKRGSVLKGSSKRISNIHLTFCTNQADCEARVHSNALTHLGLHGAGGRTITCVSNSCADRVRAQISRLNGRISVALRDAAAAMLASNRAFFSGDTNLMNTTGREAIRTRQAYIALLRQRITLQYAPGSSGGSGGVTPNTTSVTPSNTQTRPRSGRSVRGQSRSVKQQIQRCRAISSLSQRKACLKRIQ